MFLHPDQLSGGPRGLPVYAPQTTMPSLWPGGWWRVRDILEQQKIAAWATVDLAARNRETVLWNMYLKGTRQTARGAAAKIKAYAIPAAQHDPLTAMKFVNMLLASGVEVQCATFTLPGNAAESMGGFDRVSSTIVRSSATVGSLNPDMGPRSSDAQNADAPACE